jgi:acyl-CoA thioester hydrolase
MQELTGGQEPTGTRPDLVYQAKVYYGDTDAGRVVYHANYLKFFEAARTEYLHAYNITLTELEQKFGVLFTIRSLTADFIAPARLEDMLYITTTIKQLKNVTIIFSQNIRLNSKDGAIICAVEVKLGCVNAENMQVQKIPEFILNALR